MPDYRGVPGPETAALLGAVVASGLPPLHTLEPAEARRAFDARVQWTNLAPETVDRVEDSLITTRDGAALRLRLYRHGPTPRPLLLYFHGGGFVIGSIESHDPICRFIAARSQWNVISVDYRLAPEHRYPTAVRDALDAFDWVWQQADALGVDAQRIAVAGDSAGGTLAAVVAQHACRQGRTLKRQILIYPALDQGGTYDSKALFRDSFLLTQASIQWFSQHYYGHDRVELHPDASPARAADLTGLAPATIITAELDPLRDEAARYAGLLEAAGVSTQYRCVGGVIHGFLGMARYVSSAREELGHLATMLRADLQSEAA